MSALGVGDFAGGFAGDDGTGGKNDPKCFIINFLYKKERERESAFSRFSRSPATCTLTTKKSRHTGFNPNGR
jgi:hypothetical protein